MGDKDSKRDDDLLDAFCYGIAISLGNNEGFSRMLPLTSRPLRMGSLSLQLVRPKRGLPTQTGGYLVECGEDKAL